jgi:DNA-binding transcriptional MocR family regulator
MSFDALAWAVRQQVARAADKLVLLGLSDRYNTDDNDAHPSIQWLCDFSSLNRKTVITALDRLEEAGYIADSGTRYGETAQVKGYRILGDWPLSTGKSGTVKKRNCSNKDTESGTRNQLEPSNIDHKGNHAREIEDGWRPLVAEKSETAKFMATWPQGFGESEIERFVAYHQSRGNKSANWNRQWATWALGPFCRKALKEWMDERSSNGQPRNTLADAARQRIASRAGACPD